MKDTSLYMCLARNLLKYEKNILFHLLHYIISHNKVMKTYNSKLQQNAKKQEGNVHV